MNTWAIVALAVTPTMAKVAAQAAVEAAAEAETPTGTLTAAEIVITPLAVVETVTGTVIRMAAIAGTGVSAAARLRRVVEDTRRTTVGVAGATPEALPVVLVPRVLRAGTMMPHPRARSHPLRRTEICRRLAGKVRTIL